MGRIGQIPYNTYKEEQCHAVSDSDQGTDRFAEDPVQKQIYAIEVEENGIKLILEI